MNRRELLTRAAMVAAAGATAAAVRLDAHPVADDEPVPTRWDFERVCSVEADCSVCVVQRALGLLGWESGLTPKPLLCVHPSEYATALAIASAFGGVLQVWATRSMGDDECTWLVAWRGRRVGSIGA